MLLYEEDIWGPCTVPSLGRLLDSKHNLRASMIQLLGGN